jgi:hypothetical protein
MALRVAVFGGFSELNGRRSVAREAALGAMRLEGGEWVGGLSRGVGVVIILNTVEGPHRHDGKSVSLATVYVAFLRSATVELLVIFSGGAHKMVESKPSFWTTLPGILTALASLVGAVAGLIIALHHGHKMH